MSIAQTIVEVDKTPYTIRADDHCRVFINDKQVKCNAPASMSEAEKEVYEMYKDDIDVTDPNRETVARLLGALNIFYNPDDHPHIDGDATLMGLMDGFAVRVATGKPVAPRYVIENDYTTVRVSGSDRVTSLPETGSDTLSSLEFSELIGNMS